MIRPLSPTLNYTSLITFPRPEPMVQTVMMPVPTIVPEAAPLAERLDKQPIVYML